ncbi:MAG: hypothetical protein GF398_03665 [Chitinivibrionales bacterium]|nr:hypothetical protein [Chitinivibrionales bacterium]
MIVVLADDFTGAAELAGIGLRYGLNVKLQTRCTTDTSVDLLAIDSDTRALEAHTASRKLSAYAAAIETIPVDLLYKKTDSVWRGHIGLEITTLMQELAYRRALLIPANPSSGRIIKDGACFIHNTPLHLTDFANDPHFPVRGSRVREYLASSHLPVSVCKATDAIPQEGIVIGEASHFDDLLAWCPSVTSQTLAAGAAEFFAALLTHRGYSVIAHPDYHPTAEARTLFVNGSASSASRKFVATCRSAGVPVCTFPGELNALFDNYEALLDRWVEATIHAFQSSRCVLAAIDKPLLTDTTISAALTQCLALLVERLLAERAITEIFAEGGATAAGIIKRMNWTSLAPVNEIAPGTVRMRIETNPLLHFTTKPGSYPWPQSVSAYIFNP